MSSYNYPHFDEYVASGREKVEFAAFVDVLHAGDPAPEVVAIDLEDGSEVRLSELWKRQPVVMEFGSFT